MSAAFSLPDSVDPVLSVAGLTISSGGEHSRAIVEDLSLAIAPGEAVALIGESGSGKSLTALSLIDLVPKPLHASGGSVRFAGRELLADDEKALRAVRGRGIAMTFQDSMSALNPVMTIGRQLRETIAVTHPGSRSDLGTQAADLLRQVRIADPERVLGEYPHRLSGGMRQRIMIAMAIAGAPRLLLADEPTTALDVTIQAEILDLLARLRGETGLSVLLISHDLGLVAGWASRVLVMYAGRIVEQGPAVAVLRAPSHPYTAGLLRARPGRGLPLRDASGRRSPLREIVGSVPSVHERGDGCTFAPRCASADGRCTREVPVLRAPPPHVGSSRLVACHHPVGTT